MANKASEPKREALTELELNEIHPVALMAKLLQEREAARKSNPLKRVSDVADLDGESDDDEESISDYEIILTDNCDQIRRKINTFIDNGGMTVKDFLAELKVSSVSYYRFMKQHGKDKGFSSDTYLRASIFFQKRAEKGLPMPKKRKVKESSSSKAAARPAPAVNLDNIELQGEQDDAVPIFDSCDEIRRKINAHLRKPEVTQSQFLRELHAQFHGPRKPKSIQSAQLSKFRSQKGPVTGNTSGIYYAAYVYFEKQRLATGRPKSQHRSDMEKAWETEGGVDVSRNLNNVGYWCLNGRQPHMNELGIVSGF